MTATIERSARNHRRPEPHRWLWRFVVWFVLAVSVSVLVVVVAVPRLAGATPYTVLTGSMKPSYPPGTLIVIRPVDSDQIAVGDVLTYQVDSGRSAVVTHRVVSAGTSMSDPGERIFRTQGDANSIPDRDAVREVQIKGTLWYSVPHLGRVNTWVTTSERQTASAAIAMALFGYAAWLLVSARRDRNRNTKEEAS